MATVNTQGVIGTTSACAENTFMCSKANTPCWNYLRVRGEYHYQNLTRPSQLELPPRARRIPLPGPQIWSRIGTTSACAENTR